MTPPETTGLARAIAELGAERDRVAGRLAQIDQTIALLGRRIIHQEHCDRR